MDGDGCGDFRQQVAGVPRILVRDPDNVGRIAPGEIHVVDVRPASWRYGGQGAQRSITHQSPRETLEVHRRETTRPWLNRYLLGLDQPTTDNRRAHLKPGREGPPC